jgi:hypothetical protein
VTRKTRLGELSIEVGRDVSGDYMLTVSDKETDDPIEDVRIDITLDYELASHGVTDIEGHFFFTPKKTGTYGVYASAAGYKPKGIELTI